MKIGFLCDADGAISGENRGFFSPYSSHGKLCSSIQGSMEILVKYFTFGRNTLLILKQFKG